MSTRTLRQKWDRASLTYEWATRADEARLGLAKETLLAGMRGRCLMLAAGTGHDFRHFPSGADVVAIDISRGMLKRASNRVNDHRGTVRLAQMDALALGFPDACFDSIASICTFCSVPDPVRGLRELRRVLRREGRLFLFEHVRSRLAGIGLLQDFLTPFSRRLGPDLNRDTVTNATRAGFRIVSEDNAYLDIVKAIVAVPV